VHHEASKAGGPVAHLYLALSWGKYWKFVMSRGLTGRSWDRTAGGSKTRPEPTWPAEIGSREVDVGINEVAKNRGERFVKSKGGRFDHPANGGPTRAGDYAFLCGRATKYWHCWPLTVTVKPRLVDARAGIRACTADASRSAARI